MKNALPSFGLFVLVALTFTALFAPALAPHDPFKQDLYSRLESPQPAHPLGKDRLGRDILSRIIYGSRISLGVGITVVGISSVIGVTLGLIAGYFGGKLGFRSRCCIVLIKASLSFAEPST